MLATINVVYTTKRLREVEYLNLKSYTFFSKEELEVGDIITSPNYSTPMQVISKASTLKNTINGVPIKLLNISNIDRDYSKNTINVSNTNKTMKPKTNIFNSIVEKYKSQFMPVKADNLRISMDGKLCVPSNGELVTITDTNELISYPEAMTLNIPVYMISKPANQVVEGDIIKHTTYSYSKVLGRTKDGKFRLLSYSGHSTYKAEVKDFMLGQALVPVVVNMFSGMAGVNGMNPMMMMAMSDGDIDMKDMMMMSMMSGGNMGQMNPMMLMMMSEKGESSSMMETMMMMQMMGGQNPIQSMFPIPKNE